MSKQQREKRILADLFDRLATRYTIKRKRERAWTINYNENEGCCITFQIAKQYGLELIPGAGIINHAVCRVWLQLLDRPDPGVGLLFDNIGYWMPEHSFKEFNFDLDYVDEERPTREILDVLRTYAIEPFKNLAATPDLERYLLERCNNEPRGLRTYFSHIAAVKVVLYGAPAALEFVRSNYHGIETLTVNDIQRNELERVLHALEAMAVA